MRWSARPEDIDPVKAEGNQVGAIEEVSPRRVVSSLAAVGEHFRARICPGAAKLKAAAFLGHPLAGIPGTASSWGA